MSYGRLLEGAAVFLGELYTYRVRWSAEDEGHVGTVEELPSLSLVGESPEMALAGVRDLVTAVLEDLGASGEITPEAIGDRSYAAESPMPDPSELGRAPTVAERDVDSAGPVHVVSSPSDHHVGWPVEPRRLVPSKGDVARPELAEVADRFQSLQTTKEALSKASTALDNARAQLQRLAADQDT